MTFRPELADLLGDELAGIGAVVEELESSVCAVCVTSQSITISYLEYELMDIAYSRVLNQSLPISRLEFLREYND